MSYYQYMQSVYRSYLPQLNRSLRSSSVERLEGVRNQIRSTSVEATSRNMRSSSVDRSNFYTSQVTDTSRYMRSASVGPCENLYTFSSAMPFALEADKATERVNARRAASVEPVILPRKSFSYADHYASNCQPGAGYSAFDYKVGFLLLLSIKNLFCQGKFSLYLAHVIEQPNFRIPNSQYLQQNFVYLIFCLIKSRTNSQQRHL
jgi:hypothetical protein